MNALTSMLRNNKEFQAFPLTQQDIYVRLAEAFGSDNSYLYRSPFELTMSTNLGTEELWDNFLRLSPVSEYIKGQMAAVTQIGYRKGIQNLLTKVEQGDLQAIKEMNDIGGGLFEKDNNKTVVLHQIARPALPDALQTTPDPATPGTPDLPQNGSPIPSEGGNIQ